MARRAVIDKTEFLLNDEGNALVDPRGKKIRRVTWHWEDLPETPSEPTGRNPGYDDATLQALYETHRTHGGALGVVVEEKPKRYRLRFTYADGQTREADASAAEALYNEAIGRSLHSAPLTHCATELIREG